MTWNGYTVCSVISGIVLIAAGVAAPGTSAKNRLYALVGGGFFIAYGIYVAKQTSGTFYFPIWIFLIPVMAIVYLIAAARGKNKARPASHSRDVPVKRPGGSGAPPEPAPGPDRY